MTDPKPHPADWAEYHAHMQDADEVDRLRAENERLRERDARGSKYVDDRLRELDLMRDQRAHDRLKIDGLRRKHERLREVLEDARLFAASCDCTCVIDTGNIAEHTPDCAVQAMAAKIDRALEATDEPG